MRAEDIRDALQREAGRHTVNPKLPPSTLKRARLSRALLVVGVGVVAASIAFTGAGIVRLAGDSDVPNQPASGATSGTAASSEVDAPLLLITQPGWRMTYADQYGSDEFGEMRFTDGTSEIGLHWQARKYHEDYVADRRREAEAEWQIAIADQEAVLFQYEGTTDFTAMWVDGNRAFELRGVFPDVDAYRTVAATLETVDQGTWLAALPQRVVPPEDRAAVVDEMLADIPLHPDVDVARLKNSDSVSDRYQLGAHVTGAVACEWVEQWVEAKASGNAGSQREATEAMATSRDWAILKEMDRDGGYPDSIWDYADAMKDDSRLLMGRPMTIDESYKQSLGCDE
jgi:hypothetical protein